MRRPAINWAIHLNVIAGGLACLASALAATSVLPDVLEWWRSVENLFRSAPV